MFKFSRWVKALAVMVALLGSVPGLAASLLPNGKQQFINGNGDPLASGTVTFYIPGTTTKKNTWQDPGQTILNTNPVVLDGNGYAVIYGSGAYRQVLQDSQGNLVWDQLTADTSASQSSWAGNAGGTANALTLTAANFSSSNGQQIFFRATATNTGATTVNVNGSGSLSILKDMGGSVGTGVALVGGEISTGGLVGITYDSVLGAFHLAVVPTVAGPQQSVAGATTVNLGALQSHQVVVTGSGATITSFGTPTQIYSPMYLVSFTGVNTITYNANTLTTPTGTSITTAAGDSAFVVYTGLYLGTGAWQVVSYTRAVPTFSPQANGLYMTNGASPNTQIALAANSVAVVGANGSGCITGSFSKTLNTATVGANGLSTDVGGGALGVSSWYYVYAIATPACTVDTLLSSSYTSPTLPTGYTMAQRLGAWRTYSDGTLLRQQQNGQRAQYIVTAATNTAALPVAGSGSAGNVGTPTWVSLSLANLVPPTVHSVEGVANTNGGIVIVAPQNAFSGYAATSNQPPVRVSVAGSVLSVPFSFVLQTPTIYWASDTANQSVAIMGWTDNVPAN